MSGNLHGVCNKHRSTRHSLSMPDQSALRSASPHHQLYLYKETRAPKDPSPTPVGVAVFQQSDVAIRYAAEQSNNIVHWNEYERGTHFPEIDAPDLLVSDVRQFFRTCAEGNQTPGAYSIEHFSLQTKISAFPLHKEACTGYANRGRPFS